MCGSMMTPKSKLLTPRICFAFLDLASQKNLKIDGKTNDEV
jgi:hypothetical protein